MVWLRQENEQLPEGMCWLSLPAYSVLFFSLRSLRSANSHTIYRSYRRYICRRAVPPQQHTATYTCTAYPATRYTLLDYLPAVPLPPSPRRLPLGLAGMAWRHPQQLSAFNGLLWILTSARVCTRLGRTRLPVLLVYAATRAPPYALNIAPAAAWPLPQQRVPALTGGHAAAAFYL